VFNNSITHSEKNTKCLKSKGKANPKSQIPNPKSQNLNSKFQMPKLNFENLEFAAYSLEFI
jgi:hypothetical protein